MCRLSYSELFKSTGQFQFAKLQALTHNIGVIDTWFTRSKWNRDDFIGLNFH